VLSAPDSIKKSSFFRLLSFRFPDSGERGFLSRGWSERMSTIIHKGITLKFAIPTALIIALGISISVVYLPDKNLVPVDYLITSSGKITELPNPDGRLSRVYLLLSGMK
jgi:hypothetical protein